MTSAQQQTFRFVSPAPQPPKRRNLVIEAGAGTGKTTAIVAEVLRLLLSDATVDPERIVLVTFTEKAAAEIADRIHSALTELSLHFDDPRVIWPIASDHPLFEVPPKERAAYRDACDKQLKSADRLRSQTIHSFCQMLLRQHAIEAGLDPQFRIIEGFERAEFYGNAYDTWVDEETRIRPSAAVLSEWEAVLHHYGYLKMTREAIFKLIERRDLILEEGYTLGDVSEIEPQIISALKIVRDSGADSPIVTYARSNAIPADDTGIDAWIEYLAPIAPHIRSENLRKDGTNGAMKILRAGDKGDSIYDLLVGHRAAIALLSLTRRFLARVDAEKLRRGVLDFDDLLLQTRDLLEDEHVLEQVRAQFDFLFVDEFQDTDRIQARIIERLARDRSGAYVPGKTIVVGDPKQSIYGFRRADPELYDRMTSDLINEGAERRVLEKQYRSEPALLESINALFEIVLAGGDKDPNVFRPEYHRLTAALKPKTAAEGGGAPLTLLACDCQEDEDRFAREAEVIADWIASQHEGYRRFAILFRRLTHIDSYLDVFDRRGIPYVLPPTRVFLDRPSPVDLLAVLRAVAYPTDRGAEISAARTPYFGLTDTEIVAGGEAWQQFSGAIREWRVFARRVTVSQLIDAIVDATHIEDVYAALADSGRASRHLDHVRAIAYEYDQTAGGSVRHFVDEIHRRRTQPDEVEPALFDETRDAVRILTVHGAKGLEFETVIIPDLQFGSPGADAFTVDNPVPSLVLRNGVDTLSGITRTSGTRPLKDIGSLRDDAENRRLFYVAVTRAKRDVVFVCNLVKPRKEGFVKFLAEAIPSVTDASAWPESGREVTQINGITFALERPWSAAAPGGAVRKRLTDFELETELLEMPTVALEIDAVPAIVAVGGGAPQRAAGRGAGILLHRVLERWDGVAPIEPLFASIVKELGIDAETAARVEARLATVRKSAMLQRILHAETTGREFPISILAGDGSIEDRRIDRVIREAGGDVVIDYKSGSPLPEHREQVAAYCSAMERLTGRPHRGVLWYIDDEHDDVVGV